MFVASAITECLDSALIHKKVINAEQKNIATTIKIINNDECNIIKDWIDQNKNIKAELLYRLSDNGEEFSKFHELCDNKGPTLTLFYTQEGISGGIYTPLSWDNHSNWKNDMETLYLI